MLLLIAFIATAQLSLAQVGDDWDIGPGWNLSTTYPISATAGAGGSITPSGTINVIWGADQTFNINPNTGYHTSSLVVDGSPITIATSYTFSNVSASHTIAAYFAINTYNITASSDANSIITPSGIVSVNYGDNQYFSYSANTGYAITQVLVDGSPTTVSSPTGTYAFSNVQANHTITISTTTSPTPTPTATTYPTPTATTPPNPHNHPTQTLNLYMRSDTYNFSDISAYGLDTDYTNDYVSIPLTTTIENATITYGFRVYLEASTTIFTELTGGTPDAQIILNTNYTGQITSSWNCPDTTVVLGSQIIKVDVYANINNGTWTLQASYITNPLMTKELMPATWAFALNLNMSQTVGDTTCTYTFGDTDHRSTVTGITIVTPNITDIQDWQWRSHDFIGLILGSYLTVMGGSFYILIFLGLFGSLYLRHRNFGPVFFAVIIFGSGSGLSAWIFLPPYAAVIASIIIILASAAIIFKVIR